MKKMIRLATLALYAVGITQLVRAESQDNFDKGIVDSVVICHPILAKVFSGVEFREESIDTRPLSNRIVGWLAGEKFVMPGKFNILFAKVADHSTASIDERIEAFALLCYMDQDPNLKIRKHEKVAIERDTYRLTDKVVLSVAVYQDDLYQCTKKVELLIALKGEQIFLAETEDEMEMPSIIAPPLFNFNDEVGVTITGCVTREEYYPEVHYYIVVRNNETSTGNSVTFLISGLRPNTNVSIRVTPIYGWSQDFFAQTQISDPVGNAIFQWNPPDNEQTGFAQIRVIQSNQIVFSDPNLLIIPEKVITGIFPAGYDYTVYYTNQFFDEHPEGKDYAPTFGYQVRDALVSSWVKEVNEWNLCAGLNPEQPVENDSNYQVFINDAIVQTPNLYHGSFQTGTPPGEARIISIGSLSHLAPRNAQYYPELDLINSAICHEFYHGIEWSLNNGWGSGDLTPAGNP